MQAAARLARTTGHLSAQRQLARTVSTMAPPMSGKNGPAVPKDQQKPLHLYTMSTPNGKAAQIALEECREAHGTEFSFELIDITTNVQKEPWFLKICPNGRIPCLTDNSARDGKGFNVFETSAILLYLAKEADKGDKFGFRDEFERNECLQWMFFGHGGIGPMQGQLNHFGKFAKEKIPYAIDRYYNETLRLFSVLDDQLTGKYTGQKKQYLAGAGEGKYSWADIKNYPWVAVWEFSGIKKEDMDKFPAVLAWLERIKARPAVKRGSENYNKE